MHTPTSPRPYAFALPLYYLGAVCVLLFNSAIIWATEWSYAEREDVQTFIDEQVAAGANREPLESLFKQLKRDQKVLDLMQNAPERKSTWPQYRNIFISEKRIRQGTEFMRNHANLLKRAESEYGVPGKIIVAILGVETYYGNLVGSKKVARSLATLAFDYPRRSKFFLKELQAFLKLCREQKFDPLAINGSYAGAMGWPQFMPSSYLRYAVDFDGDALIDIWQGPTDAIGSIGNYLEEAGRWQRGRDMLEQVEPLDEKAFTNLAGTSLRPSITRKQLSNVGITPKTLLEDDTFKLIVVDKPDEKNKKEYWIGGANFYAVTRYNISTYYTMTVFQLANLISQNLEE